MSSMYLFFSISVVLEDVFNYITYRWSILFKNLLNANIMIILVFIRSAYIFTHPFSIWRVAAVGGVVAVAGFLTASWLKKDMVQPVNTINQCLDRLSKGGFTEKVAINEKNEFNEIALKLNNMMTDITILVNAVKANTKGNFKMAEKFSSLSFNLAKGADQASQQPQTVTSSCEQINMTMKSIKTSRRD